MNSAFSTWKATASLAQPGQTQSRNKILQSGKTPEKVGRHNGAVAVRSSAATLVSGCTDKPMPRLSVSLLGVLLGLGLLAAAVGQS
ncbi:MAG: hypothetical protein E5W21_21540, partial [Mesorhizobium sp.]